VSSSYRRVWMMVNIAITLALLPALFPDRDESGATTAVTAGTASGETYALMSPVSTMVVQTTTTVAPPTTAAPVTTEAPVTTVAAAKQAAPPTTAAPRPTTTAPPPPTTAASPPPATGSESGRATWYDMNEPGICAHKTLPFGTVVTVNAVNGKSVQCTVRDRGPFVDGYIIDLHPREFEQLTPTSAGRIDVTITW
jgi:rare lipoprotein A (peptidoglycan hydrolase)